MATPKKGDCGGTPRVGNKGDSKPSRGGRGSGRGSGSGSGSGRRGGGTGRRK